MANVHDIGAKWKYCEEEGCKFKTKYASMLRSHEKNVHDVDLEGEGEEEGPGARYEWAVPLESEATEEARTGLA
ncbi:hypothetical protein TrLO_g3598 [Triparma laevis f. longispina]|uniref:Uncharacterized protein n=1 Tax=Triparma laevis f. longispina TaxID=1714387 RepID=A0A9W7B4H0_9STRA|nr:hypothetical protein TrLO_g3598 [Triparma laevis f. longispina]